MENTSFARRTLLTGSLAAAAQVSVVLRHRRRVELDLVQHRGSSSLR